MSADGPLQLWGFFGPMDNHNPHQHQLRAQQQRRSTKRKAASCFDVDEQAKDDGKFWRSVSQNEPDNAFASRTPAHSQSQSINDLGTNSITAQQNVNVAFANSIFGPPPPQTTTTTTTTTTHHNHPRRSRKRRQRESETGHHVDTTSSSSRTTPPPRLPSPFRISFGSHGGYGAPHPSFTQSFGDDSMSSTSTASSISFPTQSPMPASHPMPTSFQHYNTGARPGGQRPFSTGSRHSSSRSLNSSNSSSSSSSVSSISSDSSRRRRSQKRRQRSETSEVPTDESVRRPAAHFSPRKFVVDTTGQSYAKVNGLLRDLHLENRRRRQLLLDRLEHRTTQAERPRDKVVRRVP